MANDSSDQAVLATVRAYVVLRQLTPADLRRQIAMPQEGRVEAVLAGLGTSDEIRRFNQQMQDRYAQPSLRTIRNRLILARAVQYGHRELAGLLSPDIDSNDTDPGRNKVLQLVEIYEHVYNLTIQAAAESDDEPQQDAWFEEHIAPWDREDLYLSILPSKWHVSAKELPEVLTSRFASLQPGQPLEDWRCAASNEVRTLLEARRARWAADLRDIESMELALQPLSSQPLDAALAAVTSIAAARMLAVGRKSARVRIAAAKRMAELTDTDDQRLDAALIHMDIYLNGQVRPEPAEAQALVNDLLQDADSNPARCRRMPQLLNARAKHFLRSNEFQLARTFFKQALEACTGDSCGDLPGLIARDLFALEAATTPNGYHAANHERHVRIMAAFEVVSGLHYPIEEVASQLSGYFWDDLYRPYPGLELVESRRSRMR